MPESTALQELQNLVNQSNQEIEALKQSWAENHEVDTLITTQCMRTLHTAKGLAKMCGFAQAATIIHDLETTISNIAKGTLAVSDEVLTQITNAITTILSILKHGEQPATSSIDYHQLGLEANDIRQLSETEKLMLTQTFAKGRPIVSYFVHANEASLEKDLLATTQKINENGTVITTIPTYAQDPKYAYAFIILFTTALEQPALTALLPTGSLTWLQKNKPVERVEMGNEQKTASPLSTGLPEERAQASVSKGDQSTHQGNQALKQAVSAIKKARTEQAAPAQQGKKITATKINFDAIEEKIWQQKHDPILNVPLSKIDHLINEVNRLLSCKIKLEKLLKKFRRSDDAWEVAVNLEAQVAALDKHVKLLQDAILNARLAKAESIEQDLRTFIASLAQEHEKKITFIFEGRDVELDKSLLEGMQNPLIHLIKNAIDHGVRTPTERLAAGKPEAGVIKLTFATSGNKTMITLEDDGQGIDLKNIRKKAVAKGLIDPVKAATLSPQELFQFIFIPGFSTKETLTQTSGRGIGMNAVKDVIAKMHGELFFESQESVGTKFTMSIPSYLAIQRLLHFLVCGQHYALPFSAISEVIPYEQERVQEAEGERIILWQGKPVKLFELSAVFELTICKGSAEANNIIILHHNKHYIAVHVHDILGQEELIIRPLNFEEKAFELFSGHADFGDDALVLIINAEKLWEEISHE